MMYLAQIAAVLYVTWASIHYDWYDGHPNGYATAVVAFIAALLVTAIIIEVRLLPSRLARLRVRIFGLKDEPRDEITSLAPPFRQARDSFKNIRGPRIGEDPRQLIKIPPKLPL